MQQTTNLDLELYEATDNANLLDGYNASMRKIDSRDGEISVLITSLSNTVNTFDSRITSAQSDATQAIADASAADSAASSAQSDATQAIAAAAAAQADIDNQLYKRQTFQRSGTTSAGLSWSCDLRVFQFGGVGKLQIVEIRGRTLGVSFSTGPSSLYYASDPTIPSITYPCAFQVSPAVIEQASSNNIVIKDGVATTSATGGANIVRMNNPGTMDVYWSIIAIGLADVALD